MPDDLASAIIDSAGRLGVSPHDLATAISYETAGTFDPWKAGPTTQWGQHRGLIQWGEPQRQKYGVTPEMGVADQMRAAEKYLTDAGVKPGMGLLDIYSAINAGGVGRYGASDANNGGAPGTVMDKVTSQMLGHRMKANQLLAGRLTPQPQQAPSAPAPQMAGGGSPAPALLPAAPGADGDDQLLAQLQQLSQVAMPGVEDSLGAGAAMAPLAARAAPAVRAPRMRQPISIPGTARQRLERARAIAAAIARQNQSGMA